MSFGGEDFSKAGRRAPRTRTRRPTAVDDDHDYSSDQPLNPWVSMWLKPRATVRQLIETDGAKRAPVVVGIAACFNGLGNLIQGFRVPELLPAMIFAFGIGLVFTFIYWLVGSWLLRVVGGWFDGRGTFSDLKIATGWVQVLSLWMAPFTIAIGVLSPQPGQQPPNLQSPEFQAFIGTVVLMIPLGVWCLVIWCRAIAEAHQFSPWLGFASVIIASLIGVVAMFAMVLVIGVGIAAIATVFRAM